MTILGPPAISATVVMLVLGTISRPCRPRRPLPHDDHRLEPARRTLQARRSLVIVALLTTWFVDPILAVGAVVVTLTAPRLTGLLAARRRQRQIEAALPDAIEMLILIVHAGLTPHQAVGALTRFAPLPTRFAFGEVLRRVERGTTLADALTALPELIGPRAIGVADTLAIAERHGTPIAVALEQLAVDVRERRRRQSEAAARTLPVKLSFPLVICTLPAFVLLAIVPAVLGALRSLGDSGL